MPLTGTLIGDFSSFVDACDQAQISLKKFEDGAAHVETSLKRMTDSLSGVKVIQQAQLMAEAVERIGGVSKLTDDELKSLGATAQEAAEKMEKLGIEVPDGIKKIADESKKAEEQHRTWTGTISDLAAGFAAMFTVDKIIRFVEATTAEASALKNLAEQTHIGVEDLQLMASSMQQFGVDADTLGRGLYKLSTGIAGGSDSVVSGLAMMGLRLQDVQNLNAEDLFLKIEHGLATLQGGLRDTAAAELFGEKLGSAMARAATSIDATMEENRKFNRLLSSENIDALDKFGTAIERTKKNLENMAASMIGPLAEGFNTLYDSANRSGFWATFTAALKDFATSNSVTGANVSNLTRLLDEQNRKMEEGAAKTAAVAAGHAQAAVAVDAHAQATKYMATLASSSLEPLAAWQVSYLQQLEQMNLLDAEHAKNIGVNAAQLKDYQKGLKDTADALRILADNQAEDDARTKTRLDQDLKRAQIQTTLTGGYQQQIAALYQLDAVEQQLAVNAAHEMNSSAEASKIREAAQTRHLELLKQIGDLQTKVAGERNAQVIAELEAQGKINAAYGLTVTGLVPVNDAYETLKQKTDELNRLREQGYDVTKRQTLADMEFTEALRKEAEQLVIVGHGVDDLSKEFPPLTGFMDGFTGSLRLNISTLDDYNKAIADFYDSLDPGVGHLGGTNASSVGTPGRLGTLRMPSFGGTRDTGGPVQAGTSYYVGKGAQPELFTPSSSGYMTAAGKQGGGTVNNTFNIVDTEANIARRISDAVARSLMQSQKLGSV